MAVTSTSPTAASDPSCKVRADASSPATSDASYPSSEALHDGYPSFPAACTHPRRAPSGPGCGPGAPPLPPSDSLLPTYSPEGRCQGPIRVYINQELSPVLVGLRSHRPLMPYRRRITIRRQSGGGALQLPRSSGTRWSSSNRSLVSSVNSAGDRITSLEGCDCPLLVQLEPRISADGDYP